MRRSILCSAAADMGPEIRRMPPWVPPIPVLALIADSRIFAWLLSLKQSARKKLPLRVRVFPDAAGRPDEASSAWSTAMLAAPPGPQPVTPGAAKVVSVAVAFLIAKTPVSGWSFGCGSCSMMSGNWRGGKEASRS